MKIENLLFDLDGTIIDSLPGIQYASESAIKAVLPGYPIPDLKPLIGPPIREIFSNLYKNLPPEIINNLLNQFRQKYDSEGCIKAKAYPGVKETLSIIWEKGINFFIITNKPSMPTKKILCYLKLESYFKKVVCPDIKTPPFKDKADMIAYLLSSENLDPQFTLFIGDSEDDRKAAINCGLQFVAAAYGYGAIRTHCQGEEKYVLSNFPDLLSLIF